MTEVELDEVIKDAEAVELMVDCLPAASGFLSLTDAEVVATALVVAEAGLSVFVGLPASVGAFPGLLGLLVSPSANPGLLATALEAEYDAAELEDGEALVAEAAEEAADEVTLILPGIEVMADEVEFPVLAAVELGMDEVMFILPVGVDEVMLTLPMLPLMELIELGMEEVMFTLPLNELTELGIAEVVLFLLAVTELIEEVILLLPVALTAELIFDLIFSRA